MLGPGRITQRVLRLIRAQAGGAKPAKSGDQAATGGVAQEISSHEGVTARALEKQGVVSDLCELNRQIREDNALIRTLKAAIVKLRKAVEATIPAIGAAPL